MSKFIKNKVQKIIIASLIATTLGIIVPALPLSITNRQEIYFGWTIIFFLLSLAIAPVLGLKFPAEIEVIKGNSVKEPFYSTLWYSCQMCLSSIAVFFFIIIGKKLLPY